MEREKVLEAQRRKLQEHKDATCEIDLGDGERCGRKVYKWLPTKGGGTAGVCERCAETIYRRAAERARDRAEGFARRPSGAIRNKPCPCGSGVKAKRCTACR